MKMYYVTSTETDAAVEDDLHLVSEMFVCWARRHQIKCVAHRDDNKPGFRVVVDAVPVGDPDDEERALQNHVNFHVGSLLRYTSADQRMGREELEALPVLGLVDLAWKLFRHMPRTAQLVLSVADLDLSLWESLTPDEVERYRPLEKLMEADQANLRASRAK